MGWDKGLRSPGLCLVEKNHDLHPHSYLESIFIGFEDYLFFHQIDPKYYIHRNR